MEQKESISVKTRREKRRKMGEGIYLQIKKKHSKYIYNSMPKQNEFTGKAN